MGLHLILPLLLGLSWAADPPNDDPCGVAIEDADLFRSFIRSRSSWSVYKMGSSIWQDPENVLDSLRWPSSSPAEGVFIVVSAFPGETDRLAAEWSDHRQDGIPLISEGDYLHSGEISAAIYLTQLLNAAGNLAESPFSAMPLRFEESVVTTGDATDADVWGVSSSRLNPLLQAQWNGFQEARFIVVPGFGGTDINQATQNPSLTRANGRTLLGRGGSDLTAMLLATEILSATGSQPNIFLQKDTVIHERDPKTDATARALAQVTFTDLRTQYSGKVVQDRAVEYAERFGLHFAVMDVSSGETTAVGTSSTRFRDSSHPARSF